MGERLIIRYDQIGSFLFLEVCSPYAQQDSDMIDDAVVARFNLKTGALESGVCAGSLRACGVA